MGQPISSPEVPPAGKALKAYMRDLLQMVERLTFCELGQNRLGDQVEATQKEVKEVKASYCKYGGDVKEANAALQRLSDEFCTEQARQAQQLNSVSAQMQQHKKRLELQHAATLQAGALTNIQQQLQQVQQILARVGATSKRGRSLSPVPRISSKPSRDTSPSAVSPGAVLGAGGPTELNKNKRI